MALGEAVVNEVEGVSWGFCRGYPLSGELCVTAHGRSETALLAEAEDESGVPPNWK